MKKVDRARVVLWIALSTIAALIIFLGILAWSIGWTLSRVLTMLFPVALESCTEWVHYFISFIAAVIIAIDLDKAFRSAAKGAQKIDEANEGRSESEYVSTDGWEPTSRWGKRLKGWVEKGEKGNEDIH